MRAEDHLQEFYEPGEKVPRSNQQIRNLIHEAYWSGGRLAKINGLPELSAADKNAMVRAVLSGFDANRDYSREVRA